MAHVKSSDTRLRVYSFKDGLLAKMAHDLEIEVGTFTVDVEGAQVKVEVDARSLRVNHAMKDGHPSPETLNARDLAKIHALIQTEVLDTSRFPQIHYEAAVDGDRLVGQLSLHGVRRPLVLRLRREGEGWVAEGEVEQPAFGIAPYQALMGALKVRPTVRIRAEVRAV